jgi:hypothetical protein
MGFLWIRLAAFEYSVQLCGVVTCHGAAVLINPSATCCPWSFRLLLGLAPIACAKKVTASGSQSCANKTNTAAGIWMDAERKKAWQMFDEDLLHARGRKGRATPQVCGEACDNARLPDLRTPVPHPNFTGRQKTLFRSASKLSVLTSHKSRATPCLALLPTAVAGCHWVPPLSPRRTVDRRAMRRMWWMLVEPVPIQQPGLQWARGPTIWCSAMGVAKEIRQRTGGTPNSHPQHLS